MDTLGIQKSYLPSIREDFVGQLFTFVFWKHTEETGELNYWISAAKRCYSVGHRHQTEFRREQTKLLLLSCAAKLDALCGWDTDNNAARQTPSNFSRIFLLYSSTISTLIWRENYKLHLANKNRENTTGLYCFAGEQLWFDEKNKILTPSNFLLLLDINFDLTGKFNSQVNFVK